MTATELLIEFRRVGVMLWTAGDGLGFNAPDGTMTAHRLKLLADRKAELVALLSGDIPAAVRAALLPMNDGTRARLLADYNARVGRLVGKGVALGDAQARAYGWLANALDNATRRQREQSP